MVGDGGLWRPTVANGDRDGGKQWQPTMVDGGNNAGGGDWRWWTVTVGGDQRQPAATDG